MNEKLLSKLIAECKKYDRIAAQNSIHQVSFYSMLIINEEKETQAQLEQILTGLKSINKQLGKILNRKELKE